MSLKKLLSIISFAAISTSAALAQESAAEKPAPTAQEIKDRVDGIDENVTTLLSDVEGLKKLKVSGYIQAQFEKTELYKGFGTSATNTTDTLLSRFRIRRSRLKFAYETGLTQMVVQADYNNTGFTLKDAYIQTTDPWTKLFTFTIGQFNRPNYEVEYSSSQLESPERSTLIRKLYPDEEDLGAMITFDDPSLFKLQVAAFNNNIQGSIVSAGLLNYRSFPFYYMTRITRSIELTDELVVDLGAHARIGNVPNNSRYFLDADKQKIGKDSSLATGTPLSRTWFGGEAQIYWDFLGGTKILGEYITGKNADLSSTVTTAAAPNTGLARLRQFSGYYAMLVKNLGFVDGLEDFQLAVKYDAYNPNTKLDEAKKEAYADLQQNTLGFGIHNNSFANIRITLWYDMYSTKDIALGTKAADGTYKASDGKTISDRKADVNYNQLTLRVQYKF